MSPTDDPSFREVTRELVAVESGLRALELEMSSAIAAVPATHRESAKNLVHYVALRQRDLRELQERLSRYGLSSLGRSESYVMGGVLAASLRAHESLSLKQSCAAELERVTQASLLAMSFETAKGYLHRHTVEMFGPRPADRHVYIMVTAPSAKEADSEWMCKLLEAGMNVLRINCAHEGEAEWTRVADALLRAKERTGKPCRVLMDLPGPKIRTGAIKAHRRIASWKPDRDDLGRAVRPARVVIRRASARELSGSSPSVRIDDEAFARLRVADELRFRDARDKRRTLLIEEIEADHVIASSLERTFLLDEVSAQVRRGKKDRDLVVLKVPDRTDAAIDVRVGDTLLITGRDIEGAAPVRSADGGCEKPGIVACTLPAALEHLQVGQRVLFDDGRIQAVVEARSDEGAFVLRIARTYQPTAKLRSEKGINLPDTRITIPGLTEDDRLALAFVVKRADAVSLSFVRSVDDVRAMHAELTRLGRTDIGVTLKIETRAGFENLPALLLEGLRKPPLSVMIARGDLAVEVGFERLAELQEEILWLCEAAHVPAIWATQVLDTLARTGVPSRAEVTDASASVAAECVMLNKGAFVHEAVAVLSSILRRMEQHRYKKRSLFRKLDVSSFTRHDR